MRRLGLMIVPIFILILFFSGCGQKDQSQPISGETVIPTETEVLENFETPEQKPQLEDEDVLIETEDTILPSSAEKIVGPYSGKLVTKTELLRPIIVMIENAPAARPQAGLTEASIVYEYLVEGGITRFAALFYEKIPKIIGPVRSTRPYFIELALEYDALLLHAGASPEGFAQLMASGVEHLDEITHSDFYWRSSTRRSPHNLYTGREKIADYLGTVENGELPEAHFPFQRVNFVNQTNIKNAKEIKIYYWGGYTVKYKYDQNTGSYWRFIDDLPHLLEGGKKIFAHNILVQYVDTKVIDDAGRLSMQIEGSNQAVLIKDGCVYQGSWVRGADDITRFLDNNDQEWSINPGQTWIQVVPISTKIEYR